jgi:TonB family protein
MLHAVIGKDGTVEGVEALCGPEMLLPSAIEAARQWTYTPFDDVDGKPLEVETTITMNYTFGPSAVPRPGSGSWINGVEVVDIPEGSPELDGASKDKPKYPKEARKAGVVGIVKLAVLIGVDGKVVSAKAVSGPDALQAAAEETVRKYRYRRYSVDGVPKMVRTTETVAFSSST